MTLKVKIDSDKDDNSNKNNKTTKLATHSMPAGVSRVENGMGLFTFDSLSDMTIKQSNGR